MSDVHFIERPGLDDIFDTNRETYDRLAARLGL